MRDEHRGNCCSRRNFLGYAGGALAAGALSSSLAGDAASPNSAAAQSGNAPEAGQSPMIWGNLLHLSMNMWRDRPVEPYGPYTNGTYCHHDGYKTLAFRRIL